MAKDSTTQMWFVYFLESLRHPTYLYVGITKDIERRLAEHNTEKSKLATAPYQPLRLNGYVAVGDKTRADSLERYFKTGSGKAFLKKRIIA